ncbi:MAG TPA: hypothetical protein VMS22_14310 [Candidatus Eisenbacteria bacterium]|nr:hypothetical protein [Candidatus Eisenbacteria bacterium]
MLADALVERYSRQILLAEVGGRGQERLLASQVAIAGDDAAARFAATLVRAAGAEVTMTSGAPGRIEVDAAPAGTVVGRWRGCAGTVATLVGRPCARCLDASVLALAAAGPGGDAAQPVGALVAVETLRVLLGLATEGRVQRLDAGRGTFGGETLSGPGCAACGASA